MKERPHILVRVVFEISFRGRDRVKKIQDRVSTFAGGRLHTVMAEHLASISDQQQVKIFEKVELDAGEISLTRLEDDLASGIARSLRHWIARMPPARTGTALVFSRKPGEVPATSSTKHDFIPAASFLSAPARAPIRGLNAAMAAALREPSDWSEFMNALRENQVLRGRMASEVSPQLLREFVHAMVPGHGTWITECLDAPAKLHERRPLVAAGVHAFRRTLWECLLGELARAHGTTLTQRSLISGIVKLLAERHAIQPRYLAAEIVARLKQHQPRGSGFVALAAALVTTVEAGIHHKEMDRATFTGPFSLQADIAGELPLAGVEDQPGPVSDRRVEDLARFLEWGVLPWSALASSMTARGMESELLELMSCSPGAVCALVRRLGNMQPVRKRIAGQFSETAICRLLGRLAPSGARCMIQYVRQLRRLHAQKPLVGLRDRELAHTLWELCLEYLAQRHWQSFDARSLLKYLLVQLAARQKVSYEIMLADVALRRPTDSRAHATMSRSSASGGLGVDLVALVEETIFGVESHTNDAPRFLIKPGFLHLYSDMDVLAYWLRWRRLPFWSQAADAEDAARRMGPLLRQLPPDLRPATRPVRRKARHSGSGETDSTPASAGHPSFREALTPSEKIERWITSGLWPDEVTTAESSQLHLWLQEQSDADWMQALRRSGAHPQGAERIAQQLPPALFLRITCMLAGKAAGLVRGFLRAMQVAGEHVAPVATPLWMAHIRRYTMLWLLNEASSSNGQTIAATDLARTTLEALALNCRLPYGRLLNSVQEHSAGQHDVQELCRVLQQAQESQVAQPARTVALPRFGKETEARSAFHTEPASHPSPAGRPDDPQRGRLEMLSHLLRTGSLPAWGGPLAHESSSLWLDDLPVRQPEMLLKTLRPISAQAGAMERLIRYLPAAELAQIIRASSPDFGGFYILYIHAGSALADDSSLSPAQRSQAETIHWQEVLRFQLDEHAPRLGPAEFVLTLGRRISRHLAMTETRYTECLLQAAKSRAQHESSYTALVHIVTQALLPVDVPAESSPDDTMPAESGAKSVEHAETEQVYSGVPELSTLQQLEYLLRHGTLPQIPVADTADRAAAPATTLEEFMLRAEADVLVNPAAYRRYALKAAERDVERKRMARILSPKLLDRLWPTLLPEGETAAQATLCLELLQEAAGALSAGRESDRSHIAIEELLSAIVRSQGRRLDSARYLRDAALRLSEKQSLAPEALIRQLRVALKSRPKMVQEKLSRILDRTERETSALPLLCRKNPQQPAARMHLPARAPEPLPEGESFYIANAGSVLLWPFLSRYFQVLGLTELGLTGKDMFRDNAAQNRALHLVQYLATGAMEAPEHQLLLNKVLCGVPPEQPIECPAPITESEARLSDELLRGVLHNWEKLRNTSIEGLRNSFLIREGSLLRNEDAWSLTVSAKGYDILLDSLPWRFSMVKLPWMNTLVHVKWR